MQNNKKNFLKIGFCAIISNSSRLYLYEIFKTITPHLNPSLYENYVLVLFKLRKHNKAKKTIHICWI